MSCPFDNARYKALLEGLEITILPLSKIREEHLFLRIDAEHNKKTFLSNIANIKNYINSFVHLGEEVQEMTGGATPLGANYPNKGIPFLRVQNIKPNYIDDSDIVFISPADNAKLSRSQLKTNDILLTITGAYGHATVVTSKIAGSNINQHSVRFCLKNNSKFNPFFISTFLNAAPGKLQSDQNVTGVTRPALDYKTISNFIIPRVSSKFQEAIEVEIKKAHELFDNEQRTMLTAEHTLLRTLGMEHWKMQERLTYVRQASEVFAARRINSEFHQPYYDELYNYLSSKFEVQEIGKFGEVSSGTAVPYDEHGLIPVIRSGDLSDIEDDKNFLRTNASKTFLLQVGDVLISSIGFGSIGKVQVFDKVGNYGTVSEVTVIRQKQLNPYYLLFYLRSPIGQNLINRYITGATGQLHLYPKDVCSLYVPLLSTKQQQSFELFAKESRKAKMEAHKLLTRAKWAVELCIAKSEVVALEYLNTSIR